MNHFSDAELQTLSAEIDSQLMALAKESANDAINKRIGHTPKTIPSQQKQQLEQATGESADSFMTKFIRAAKKDLCLEGGVLHEQWKKYGDLSNEDMIKTFSGVLIGMGISNAFLATALVAVSVIVLHIGITVYCEDCE
jgi:hypothetical protein